MNMFFSAPEDDRETTQRETHAAFARSVPFVAVAAVSDRRVVGATGNGRHLGAPALAATGSARFFSAPARGSSVS
jgi:hypothetical protein